MSNIWCIEYASGESSATTGKTFPKESDGTTTFAKWFQCVGSGTVVAVCEGGQVFTRHASGGEVYKGSFTSLTSTTCTYLVMGNGPPPPSLPVAGISNSDARVNTIEVPVSLSGSDGSLAETIVWRAPYNCTITGAFLNSSIAMAASNTDYDTFTLANRPVAGPGTPATVIATTTKAADLNALAAYTEKSLATVALTNTATLAGDILTFKSAASGAGKASGPALLRITFTVP